MSETLIAPSRADRSRDRPASPAAFTMRDGVAIAYASMLRTAEAQWHADIAEAFGGDVPTWLAPAPVIRAWSDAVLARLTFLSLRTLVLELNVSRLQEELVGHSPELRFRSFFDHLARPARLDAFLSEYAVLARHLETAIDTARRNGLEALRHLAEDAPAIAAKLAFDPLRDQLVSLAAAGGADRHNGGRAVLVAHWASGRRLLYKPRPSQVDVHFEGLLGWIAARDASFRFRQPAAVAAGDHGWCEFIEHRPCAALEDVQRFYRREGESLALLHALGACDFHHENLIADGPWPVLVDMEALFHPTLACAPAGSAVDQANAALCRTVLRVGLLPLRVAVDDRTAGADIGGISAPASQLTPMPVLTARAAGTDQMILVREPVRIDADAHRVTLPDGRMPPAVDHADSILAGFDRMYGFLLRHRDALLAADGPIAAFDRDRVRTLIRSTRVYSTLLQESTHPDALRTPDDMSAVLGRLGLVADGARPAELAAMRQVVAAEQHDLAAGDVPIFWTRVDETVVQDTRRRRIPGLLAQSPRDAVRDTFRGLGAKDRDLQRWVIRTSLASLPTQGHVATGQPRAAATGRVPARDAGADDVVGTALRLAQRIGDRLGALAFHGDGDAAWLGLNPGPQGQWEVGVLHDDFYGGVAGVTLFLAYLARATGTASPRLLAQSALDGWLGRLDGRDDSPDASIGAFTGDGGTLYVLTHLGVIWNRPDLLARATRCATRIRSMIAADTQFDVIGGAAGCIAALLGLHGVTHAATALRAAMECGERLLAAAEPQASGWGWPVGAAGGAPLGGFSHGAAGIGWALSRLAAATREPRYAAGARQAFAYDGSLHDRKRGQWRDLRPGASPAADGSGYERWCHGGPGIALARLDSRPVVDDGVQRQSLAAALRSTLRNGRGGNHCLCHGELGNLETLLQAERRLSARGHWGRRAERALRDVVANIDADGWRCGIPLDAESPGLMTGLSGIGYGLLRAALPRSIPAVLLLEPPPTAMS